MKHQKSEMFIKADINQFQAFKRSIASYLTKK